MEAYEREKNDLDARVIDCGEIGFCLWLAELKAVREESLEGLVELRSWKCP
jgi:hypothetical protein